MFWGFSVSLFWGFFGCVKDSLPQYPPPSIQGHRISGHERENSLSALSKALSYGYGGVEFDVVLSKDNKLVLHHDYWIDRNRCREKDGVQLTKRVLLRDYTVDELNQLWVCRDVVNENSFLTISDLILALTAYPNVALNIDIKYEQKYTAPIDDYVHAVLTFIQQHPQRKIFVSTSSKQISLSLKRETDAPIFFDFPHFGSHQPHWRHVLIALQTKIGIFMGIVDFVVVSKDARADGVSIPYQILSYRQAEEIKSSGLLLQVWTPNTKDLLHKYCSWPIDILLSDYPERASCFQEIP